jgi:hypothetical protein
MVATKKPAQKVEVIPGFEEVNIEDILRILMNVEGMEKGGKSHFALTAPGPISLIDMDTGLEGVVNKFSRQKKIYRAYFNYHDATSQTEWDNMWKKMKQAFYDSLATKSIRTIIADTASEMWELCRMAAFGKLAQVKPHHYAPVNAEFRDLIRKAYDSDKNLILIHKQKKEYVDEKWTGNMERAGFGDIGYAVQANLISWRITKLDEQYGKGREDEYKGFGITVKDCRQNAELAGQEYLEPLNTFPVFASQVFPESDERDWE